MNAKAETLGGLFALHLKQNAALARALVKMGYCYFMLLSVCHCHVASMSLSMGIDIESEVQVESTKWKRRLAW